MEKYIKKANKVFKFANGATILYQKSKLKGYKGTAMFAGFSKGANVDSIPGIMHLAEHMLASGTKRRTKQEIDDFSSKVYVDAFTSQNYMAKDCEFSNKIVDEMFDFVSDCLLNSQFPENLLESEKGVIDEEMHRRAKKAETDLAFMHDVLYYPNCDGVDATIGTKETVASITSADLREFTKKHFTTDSFVLSVCTSLPFRKIKNLTKKHFLDNMPTSQEGAQGKVETEYSKGNAMRVLTNNSKTVEFVVTFLSDLGKMNSNNPAGFWYVGKCLQAGGVSLFDDLRNQGLIYEFRKPTSSFNNSSMLMFSFSTSPEKFMDVINCMGKHIHHAFNNPLSKEEMEELKAVRKLENDVCPPVSDKPYTVARWMFRNYCQKNESIELNERKMMKDLKSEDVEQFVHALFNEDARIQISIRGNLTEKDVPTYEEFRKIFVGGLGNEMKMGKGK